MSDAKQALASVKRLEKQLSVGDKNEIFLAESMLADGEKALAKGNHSEATALFSASKRHAQNILKKYQPGNNQQNIQFRY